MGGGRAGEMSGRYKRDGGEERRVRGGGVSETGGGVAYFPGRPLSLLVKKTRFIPENSLLGFFLSPRRKFLFVLSLLFAFLFFLW